MTVKPYRADGGDISTDRIKEIANNPYGDEEKCWLAKRVLALQAELKFEHEQHVMASRALITQHDKANEAVARIAETENDKSRMVDAIHAAVALNSAGISLNDFEECVLRLHEWGSLPDYCIALYIDFIHGFVSENKLLDFGYINDNGAFAARQAEKRIAELTEALKQTVSGYKTCLRTGYERILDLDGDCDTPEVMIAGSSEIQHAEKLLAAAAAKGE